MRYKTFFSTLPAWILMACLAFPALVMADSDPTMIFLVRHAEKTDDGRDPDLSEAGKQRAQALALLLKDAGIERIYSTDYTRTRDTANPLAAQLNVPVQLYKPKKLKALAASISQTGHRTLVVGHSNTTPEMVKLLGGDPGDEIEEDGEYNRLYILTIEPDLSVTTLVLRYGADTGH